MSETTLRDALAGAIDDYQEPEADPTQTESDESVASEADKTERVRDETGRFAKGAEPVVDDPVVASEATPKAMPRPSSWRKDYEQDWDVLPDRIREYINEREGQYAKGVSTYKSQWDQAAPVYEAIQQFVPELQQHNINPSQWITNLGNAHRTLALGSPEQKMQMFAKLATDYGVNIQGLISGGTAPDPQFSQLATELNSIKNQWTQFQTAQQQEQQDALKKQVTDFSATAPHFEEVKGTMAKLLQGEVCSTLQDAYDKAIRLHDDIFQQSQAEQAKAAETSRLKAIAEKKAKAVSPRSASPTGAANTSGGKKSIRETLEEEMSASGSII